MKKDLIHLALNYIKDDVDKNRFLLDVKNQCSYYDALYLYKEYMVKVTVGKERLKMLANETKYAANNEEYTQKLAEYNKQEILLKKNADIFKNAFDEIGKITYLLNNTEYQIFVMHYINENPLKDIADKLHISYSRCRAYKANIDETLNSIPINIS